jgi:hypothetical protein
MGRGLGAMPPAGVHGGRAPVCVPALELGEPLVETDPRFPMQDLTSQSLVEPVRGGQLLYQEAGQRRILG